MKRVLALPLTVLLLSLGTGVAAADWTWIEGRDVTGESGTYGTLGTPAVGNTPGARREATWGRNTSGQLGNGGTKSQPKPVAVSSLTGVVAAGLGRTVPQLAPGAACWGRNALAGTPASHLFLRSLRFDMRAMLGGAFYYDSVATLIVDGRIAAATQEERFTRTTTVRPSSTVSVRRA